MPKKLFGYEMALHIMDGENIIFPDKIARMWGLSYSKTQLEWLMEMLPPEYVLHWCKENDYSIMACPPESMSLLKVSLLNPELFANENWWHPTDNFKHSFVDNDKTTFGWLAICKSIVPRNQEEQHRQPSNNECIPNAGELAWFILNYYKMYGVRLFLDVHVRTSSITSHGRQVTIGTNSLIISVSNCPSNNTLSCAWKLPNHGI